MAWEKRLNLRGPRGVSWFNGEGPPDPAALKTQGALAGDLYLDLISGDVYVLS